MSGRFGEAVAFGEPDSIPLSLVPDVRQPLRVLVMHLALGALVLSTVALPAVARFDVYRCTVMQTTHLASCCGGLAVSKTDQVRPDQNCCDFDEGSDAPSGATSTASVVAGAASTWAMPTLPATPPSRVLVWNGVRSRAPPDTPLWLQHSSLLL